MKRYNTHMQSSQKKIAAFFLGLLITLLVSVLGLPKSIIPSQNQAEDAVELVLKAQDEFSQTLGASQGTTEKEEGVLVTRVIDGDTIELETGEKVRYIGIDTPEKDECYFEAAKRENELLVLDKRVKLEKDVSETDRYGRLLRYVEAGEIFVNDYLVRSGYALASSYPPDIDRQLQLREAQIEAKTFARGLWNECQKPTPTVAPSPTASPTATPTVNSTPNAL